MGKTSQAKAEKPQTFWLPGFEPEGYAPSVTSMVPPAKTHPSTPVAIVSAVLAETVLPILPTPPAVKAEEVYADAVMHSFEAEVGATEFESQGMSPASQDVTIVLSDDDFKPDLEADVRSWPAFDASRYLPRSGMNERIETNLQAIETMIALRADRSQVTDDDRHKLLAYCGWGGASRVFEPTGGDSVAGHRKRLETLLTQEEFNAARASVTSAFYTEPAIIEVIWHMVRKLGFQGGRIVEPAAGSGMFLAHMPPDIASKSQITAVEIDAVSAELLECTFGTLGVNVKHAPIEKSGLAAGSFDLAISNVPFGDHRSLETRNVPYKDQSLHNYFISKSIDLVRPGGLVVMITSSFTMDSQRAAHRQWMDSQAEMLGAYRLPANAFKRLGGTEVVTDLLVFRKREASKFSGDVTWAKTVAPEQEMFAKSPQGYTVSVPLHNLSINEWYVKHPQALIGKLVCERGQFSQLTHVLKHDGDIDEVAQRLMALAGEMPADVYKPRKAETVQTVRSLEVVSATRTVKPGSFLVHDGRICVSKDDHEWIDVDDAYTGKVRERMLGMMEIRAAARELINVQIASDDDVELKRHQGRLNVVYDNFVSKYGNVAASANVRVFKTDPDCPLLLSLESYNEETEQYVKAAIFTKRTAGKRVPPSKVGSVKDAMLVSLGLYGRIRMSDMVQRTSMTEKEIKKQLQEQELAFIDPETGLWVTASEYLSGHIRNKIATAQAAGGKFAMNVKALTEVLPEDLGPSEVEVRLGAPWIPSSVIKDFIVELVEPGQFEIDRLEVDYTAEAATWVVKTGGSHEHFGKSALNTARWGNTDRSAVQLVEAALNQQPPTITRTDGDSTYVDKKATMAARERYETIKHEFKAWAYRDATRRDTLLQIYNTAFNQIVERKYDGSHLILQGMSPVITPYQHQLDAIWRIVSGGNTLLAHEVGAGKSFTMIASCMEMRRIGKANKPLIAVPNNLLEQFVGECLQFYPTANILMATKEDLCGAKRHEFVARVASGDWDAVVMTHATFERIPVSPAKTRVFVDQLLGQVRLAMASANEDTSRHAKRTVKQCEKMIKTIETKVERALNEEAKDDLVYFDQLGIDFIMADEAHLFKNLLRISRMKSVAGLPNVSSNRAFDMWMKTSTIMDLRGGKEEGVVMATATPISNSLAEMHVLQKYLQPETLKAHGLYEFDAWSATYGEVVQGMEISPDGGGYRLASRYSKFVNVADLMSIFRQVADIRTRSMLNLPTPAIKGGKPTVITSKSSEELKAFTAKLVERAEKVRNGTVKPDEDNMLAITNEGRKAALDMRLIDPTQPFDPNGKVAKAVKNIVRVWKETTEVRGTQLVFCDLSTPKSNGFSVYNDLRNRLVEAGIPSAEIEFIHDHDTDAKKAVLFRNVRAGRVRVLMGSTTKMGMGTNVQKRLKALWQLDPPWRPADVTQRDGRALRAGNMHDEIELGRFVTEGSFDAYVWSLLETKARFIDQVMTARKGLRTVEDLAMGALSYAEVKAIASGNPAVLRKAQVDADVMRLSLRRDEWENTRWRLNHTIKSNRSTIADIQRHQSVVAQNAEDLSKAFKAGLEVVPYDGWCESALKHSDLEGRLGTQIAMVSRLRSKKHGSGIVGEFAGFSIEVEDSFTGPEVYVVSKRNGKLYYSINRTGVPIYDVSGTGSLVLQKLRDLCDLPQRQERTVKRLTDEVAMAEQQMNAPFEDEEKLQEALREQREIESLLDLNKDQAGVEDAKESTDVPADQAEPEEVSE